MHRNHAGATKAWLAAVLVSLWSSTAVLTAQIPGATDRLQPLFAQSALQKVQTEADTGYPIMPPRYFPAYTNSSGPNARWLYNGTETWTSGFFSDELYALDRRFSSLCPHDQEGSGYDWRGWARVWSNVLYWPYEASRTDLGHDVGFISAPMMAELVIDSTNQTARQNVLDNANALASLYSPVVGCTRSWYRGGGSADVPDQDFEVIIDNMANLPLLLAAADLTGNATYRAIAESHANKTIENHVRPDGGSFHVVNYNPTTGDIQWRGTAQGYSNSSTWSRGQAWGMLGFALMYNATGAPAYLETAGRMANYFATHLDNTTGIAPWDFNAPPPLTYDTSASTIAATAMLVLSSLEASRDNVTGSDHWAQTAQTLLINTIAVGMDETGTGQAWSGESILGNGTVNNRADPPNNNTGTIYGDSYFIHAGNHLLSLGLVNCTSGSPATGASRTSLSSSLVTFANSSQAFPSAAGAASGTSGGQAAASASPTHTSAASRAGIAAIGVSSLSLLCGAVALLA
ncbi:hypothetical protein JCM10908_004556 [Rhodotorula pacifica]|uniref:uncharacterized protein n=1 Tax=Rhodotorula pacifica TaxID=1495444 RepID=UPI00316CAF12